MRFTVTQILCGFKSCIFIPNLNKQWVSVQQGKIYNPFLYGFYNCVSSVFGWIFYRYFVSFYKLLNSKVDEEKLNNKKQIF